MGNLLGAPVTDKETESGVTEDNIGYAVSSMQGWRVHMEDAHIAETKLYAARMGQQQPQAPPKDTTATTGTQEENSSSTVSAANASTNKVVEKIMLPGHAIFGVFDGHGGKYAALYAGRNLCRVLSRRPKFVQYAEFEIERPTKEKTLTTSSERSEYLHTGLQLLQDALCEAFVELDREIACALRGRKVPEADTPYNEETVEGQEGGTEPMQGVSTTGQQVAANQEPIKLEEEGDSGTTACVVVITPEWIICANAGDSRSVMSKLGNKVVPLSFDHKPDSEPEEQRIRAAGGYVAGGRVEGDLAVSRGLGDFRFKDIEVVMAGPLTDEERASRPNLTLTPGEQKVSPIPDILVQNRNNSQDEFIIVACDGIWDVQSNYEAVKTVADLFQEGESDLGLICEEICDVCLTMGSKDNMTALVVKFEAQKVGEGGGVLARRKERDAARNEREGRTPSVS